jgi:hypothetical protein
LVFIFMIKYPLVTDGQGREKKLKNQENWKKKTKKLNCKKKLIKNFKKSTGSVRFWFYKHKTEKTEPNPNKKKPSQIGKNQAKPVWISFYPKKPNKTKPKPAGLNWFWFFL